MLHQHGSPQFLKIPYVFPWHLNESASHWLVSMIQSMKLKLAIHVKFTAMERKQSNRCRSGCPTSDGNGWLTDSLTTHWLTDTASQSHPCSRTGWHKTTVCMNVYLTPLGMATHVWPWNLTVVGNCTRQKNPHCHQHWIATNCFVQCLEPSPNVQSVAQLTLHINNTGLLINTQTDKSQHPQLTIWHWNA